MSTSYNTGYILYDDPLKYYNAMLDDIKNAKSYIYLETYRFNNDMIGLRFRDALTAKSKQGVEIKLLMDSWGTSLPRNFFSELVKAGGEIRYFQKLRVVWDFFTRNHKRNHRKLIVIDDEISYIGSGNLTDYSLSWRESILRMKSDIAPVFKRLFLQHFDLFNKYVFEKKIRIRNVSFQSFEIIRDVPSLTKQRIRKRYIDLIRTAKTEVVIETPYFLPSRYLRKALTDAAKRGVEVKVIMPRNSDVGIVDVLRNHYLGPLFKSGIELLFYLPHNLHAKMMLVDKETFSIGSPNFDYRSFRFQHEIVIVGIDEEISRQVDHHIHETILNSEPFDYETWLRRPAIQKFFEWLILPFRHLL
jgi:cardiolipin synthase